GPSKAYRGRRRQRGHPRTALPLPRRERLSGDGVGQRRGLSRDAPRGPARPRRARHHDARGGRHLAVPLPVRAAARAGHLPDGDGGRRRADRRPRNRGRRLPAQAVQPAGAARAHQGRAPSWGRRLARRRARWPGVAAAAEHPVRGHDAGRGQARGHRQRRRRRAPEHRRVPAAHGVPPRAGRAAQPRPPAPGDGGPGGRPVGPHDRQPDQPPATEGGAGPQGPVAHPDAVGRRVRLHREGHVRM
ncbi:MAG: Two-component transcriptional response regulator, LuxR family, partial [uncultured Phycisphaerae bacterium]